MFSYIDFSQSFLDNPVLMEDFYNMSRDDFLELYPYIKEFCYGITERHLALLLAED